ncbi:right-handed parallel beta-helix repeat-containing protein [Blastomonas sp. AAP53]|uniref:beta strand repeat-containing protein n=1 Tax=Blastomonas sp. AAP53 TaxID=1248760 RepID=UPI0009D92467|nr:right-handed parallel beta-helix repeat-containing protein [Blastomonas sp. AAP53]
MTHLFSSWLSIWPKSEWAGLRRADTLPALVRTAAMYLAAALLAAAGIGQATAQTITVDPATAVQAASSSVSMNHTVGSGSNRFLIVTVAIERDSDRVTAITYAGQPLTFFGTRVDPTNTARLEVWRLIAPATGTNTVSVTFNSSASVVVAAISFANVDQANPIAASQFASGTGASDASVSVASATDQLVLSAIAANDAVDSVTPMAGQTSRWNVLNAADVIGAGSTTGGSSTTTMRYLLQSPQAWAMGAFSIRPSPAPWIVTNTNDSGAGSLREVVTWANLQPGPVTVIFAIPGAGPHTITLASALPNITANGVTIDGTTQSGTQCRDLWAGNGHDLRINVRGSSGFDGFRLAGANQTIKGLSLTGFQNAIRPLPGNSNATIQCNYLGLLANGTSSGNARGVRSLGGSPRIGGLDAGQGNVISANTIAGVVTEQGSTDTAIRGNFIGTDATGMTARPNGTGINNFFGTATWRDITRNLISGNNAGIVLESDDAISASTDQIRIQRNRIGFNRDLSALLLNGTNTGGIWFAPGSITNVLIGGLASSEGNEIAGSRDGIVLQGVSNIRIRGNTIARSGSRGIWVENGSNITIGGIAGTEGNRIGGNASDGIRLLAGSTGITILGNLIQPVAITGGTYANGEHGIAIDGASNVVIGDGTASGRNIISGNGMRGIQGSGTNSAITINGNYIGTDATGNVAVANGDLSGPSQKDAVAFDSGAVSNVSVLNNVIGGYASALVEFFHISSVGITIQGNNIGVGADGTSRIVFGNNEDLIWIGGNPRAHDNVLIGGTAPGQGNIVAFGSQSGIHVDSTGSNIQVIGNTVRNNARNGINVLQNTKAAVISNRVYDNGLIGIDLAENGVTTNDAGDSDSGPNDLLNFPEITSVSVVGSNQLIYDFTLDAPADGNGYRIEFFANSAADGSGYGEGETLLGHVDIAHNGGSQSYSGTITSLVPVGIGNIISATATRKTAGGAWDITSEFSATATAQGVAQLNVALTTEPYDQGSGAGFSTPGSDVSLTATVTNTGSGSTQSNSIFTVISINAASSFFNAETPAFGGIVRFTSASPMLTFTPGTDMRFSNAATAPTEFAQCTYTPEAGYDPMVRYVCLNPKGSLPHGAPENQFSVQLRARIN